jgi:hypothetical protein
LNEAWSKLDLGSRSDASERDVVLVRQLGVQRVRLHKDRGTVTIKVSCYARMMADAMNTRCADELISLRLTRGSSGWRLDPSSDRTYLSGDAAADALSERLATLIREGAPKAEQVQAADLLSALLRKQGTEF